MRKSCNLLLLASLLCAAPLAQAEDTAPANVAAAGKNLYVGIGLFGEMLNANVETVTRWGNFHGRLGRFLGQEGIAANVSWRKPLEGDDGHAPGFYIGLFGGHVASEQIAEEAVERLGAGAEMGYHWVKEYTRSELTVGLGAAEPVKEKYVEYKAEPTLFISFSMALGY